MDGVLTLSNEITPCKASRRVSVCARLSGSLTAIACDWSVGSISTIDGHVIHLPLHLEKEMMVKVWYVYRLVYHQVEYLTCSRIIMGNNSANSLIGLRPKGWVISHNLYWSIVV